MNNRILFFILFFAFVAAVVAVIATGEGPVTNTEKDLKVLRIALTPTQDPDQLMETSKPLIDFLEKELGCEVQVKTADDYSSIVTALATNKVDVAFMPGLPAVFAQRSANCRPICIQIQRGRTYYYSHIYARADSDIKSLGDMKGRSIAFSDQISSSGFLYPLALFYEKGLLKKKEPLTNYFGDVKWTGGYETSLTAMYNGQVDASAGSQHAPTWYLDEEQRKEIVKIGEAGPLPTHGIVASKSLGAVSLNRVQAAFMALNKPEYKKILKSMYHADGLEEADETTYESVFQKALSTGLFDDKIKALKQ